jgi:hypothetical protein
MLGSMVTTGGTILYHIGYGGYGTPLGCLAKFRCWLIGVWWVAKPDYDWICDTSTPTYIASVFILIGGREVISSSLINYFNLSSTKGQFLNSCLTWWQMHMLMQFEQWVMSL